MESQELRKLFLDFFAERGHKVIPSSPLLPTDPSVLFTTAGMQQFSLYLSGKKDPVKDFNSRHLVTCQKCFRTGDIEEIGDDTHHTFFEMLGNWSIGQDEKGYFKEGAIEYALEFLVDKLGLDKKKIYVTVFKGEDSIVRDEEAINIWLKHGIPLERIKECSKKDNFWGPVSDTGPCGPCSEIHYDRGEELGCGRPDCGPNCEHCKRVVEIWNLVFMQYFKNEKGEYELLSQTNIDTGIGFERLLSLLNQKSASYETDLFADFISKLEEISGHKYLENKKAFRIIADHIRSSVFVIADGVEPSNLGQGYILRRLLRRVIRYGKTLGLPFQFYLPLIDIVIDKYKDVYLNILTRKEDIIETIKKEEYKFEATLEKGLLIIEKMLSTKKELSGEEVFDLYQSYGFPLELTQEIAAEKGISIDINDFNNALEKHQSISRSGAEKKFGGVGKDAGEEGAKLHTATHLLHSSLRSVLGEHVQQMGSDINAERLRFDFKHNQKMTPEEIKRVEDLVNLKIKEDLEIKKEEMNLDEALKSGAIAFFKEKYPDKVYVWTMFDPNSKEVFSKEICAGPHVEKTSQLKSFKIIKEESSSAGVRRIKAVLNQ
ncbi:MAG TPA: alanine--tRNA ligase [Candidatus Pacearchaeota archaeon]|nr:alanine--tRNA ligase [Candidatus Pacearchaeota archaeon]HPR80270.1 alanine--tRNA ligase [Candidatus Pacearchaeota archaeon]